MLGLKCEKLPGSMVCPVDEIGLGWILPCFTYYLELVINTCIRDELTDFEGCFKSYVTDSFKF